MDDVEIEVVDDQDYPHPMKKEAPRNRDLSLVSEVAAEVMAQYGWTLLVLAVVVYLFIQYLSKRRRRQEAGSRVAESPEDATEVVRRQEKREAFWRKKQEELDVKSVDYKEKQKQQEEAKRRQKIEMWDSLQQGKSYKGAARLSQTGEETGTSATTLKPKTDKKPFRGSDYNPLSGQGGGGGSCSWRPGRRGPSSGG
ncbi:selenoprotein S [Pholidichthys leucotaenia]